MTLELLGSAPMARFWAAVTVLSWERAALRAEAVPLDFLVDAYTDEVDFALSFSKNAKLPLVGRPCGRSLVRLPCRFLGRDLVVTLCASFAVAGAAAAVLVAVTPATRPTAAVAAAGRCRRRLLALTRAIPIPTREGSSTASKYLWHLVVPMPTHRTGQPARGRMVTRYSAFRQHLSGNCSEMEIKNDVTGRVAFTNRDRRSGTACGKVPPPTRPFLPRRDARGGRPHRRLRRR